MKLGSIKYLTSEGIKSAWINRLMTFASIGVLVACMVLIGFAILISENVDKALGTLEQQNVVMAYMKDYSWAYLGKGEVNTEQSETTSDTENTEESDDNEETENDDNSSEIPDKNEIKPEDYMIHTEEEALAICEKIKKIPNVAKVEFISGEKGLENSLNPILENYSEEEKEFFSYLYEENGNPMSGAARITMKDMKLFDETLEKIKEIPEISNIRSHGDTADKIVSIKNGIGVAGIWIIAILLLISLVIVSNTIRVTMYNRKLDISIMKAVGATDAFVRIPFVVEGIIIGLVSAVIAEGLLYFCYRVATETLISTLSTTDIVKFGDMALILLLVFAGIGVFAGVIGSAIMIRKYLRREGSEFAAI